MSDPLEGPKLKVERANRHINEIANIIIRFFENNPRTLTIEDDPANGERHYKVRAIKQLPIEIAIIAGEILYNLRSALDQLVGCACAKRGLSDLFKAGFPIERARKKFESVILHRKIDKIFPDLADLLRSLKPYDGGNSALWLIHALNVIDKHKVIVTTAAVNIPGRINLRGKPLGEFEHVFKVAKIWLPLNEDAIVFICPAGMELEGEITILADIAISEIHSVQHQPIVTTLQQLCDATREVVGVFETRFFNT